VIAGHPTKKRSPSEKKKERKKEKKRKECVEHYTS
jgi:hypothetical protein